MNNILIQVLRKKILKRNVACLKLLTSTLFLYRKFVFAPRCRGVSAKRSAKLNNDELRELGDMDDGLVDWPRSSPDEVKTPGSIPGGKWCCKSYWRSSTTTASEKRTTDDTHIHPLAQKSRASSHPRTKGTDNLLSPHLFPDGSTQK
ncbi:hypothetical protein CEXT_255191 [Caerostris extrusa]|uniref:Uncharacterized protein n=1 Tax=Caerostris extrusa TaxID=172846 RepID=A0AAV4UAS4_CAEEX|nr:hypothetical protein CEXT_255191 [Caerostris extrusa]